MVTFLIALRAAVYGAAFLSIWAWLALVVRRYDDALLGRLPEWAPWPGALLLALGGALMLACVGVFVVHGRGTAAPFDPPRQFVVRGPYRHVRNPMYVGALVALAGLGLCLRSPAMVAFVIVPAVCAALFVRMVEEPGLERRFGERYRAYKRTVPRWLPRF